MAEEKFLSGVLKGLGPDGYLGQQFPKLGAKRQLPGSGIKRFGIGYGVKLLPYLASGVAGAIGGSHIGTGLQENIPAYDRLIQSSANNKYSSAILGGLGNVFASYVPGVAGPDGTLPGAQWWGGDEDQGSGLAALIDNYSKNNQTGKSGMPLTTEQLIGKSYGAAYDPATGNWTAAKDPYLDAQIANALQGWEDLRGLMPQAQQRIAGYYANAANQARQRADIFGEQGERTAGEVGRTYTSAGQQVADLAGAGGTSVSGLTGPSQTFQSLYGTLPGTGVTGTQDVRAQTGFAVRTLDDYANDAARSGTAEGKNIANYINKLGIGERTSLNNMLIQDQRTRAQSAGQAAAQYQLEQAGLAPAKQDQALQQAGLLWSGKGKNAVKDAMEKLTGTEIKDEGQLYNSLFSLAETEGWDRINFALSTAAARYAQ